MLNGSIYDIPKTNHMFIGHNSSMIKSTVALVHHYRKGCQDGVMNCYEAFRKDIILDTRLREFKDKPLSRFNETLSKLDMEV